MEQHQQKEEKEKWRSADPEPARSVSVQLPSKLADNETPALAKSTSQSEEDASLVPCSLNVIESLIVQTLLSNCHVFVISEENMTQCKALLKINSNATVMCSFYKDNDVSMDLKSEFEGVNQVFVGVDVLKLEDKVKCVHPPSNNHMHLPFLVATSKPWALWYQGAFAHIPSPTSFMLKRFLAEAYRVLRVSDYVLIGWSKYYEDVHKSYCIDELISNTNGKWRVEARDDTNFYDAIAANGYKHVTNVPNGEKLWGDHLPKMTLILQRI